MGIEQQQTDIITIGPQERLRRVEEAEKALGEVVTSMSRVGVGHPSFAQLFGSASTLRQEIDSMKGAIARDAQGDKRLYGTGSAWKEFKKGLGIESDPVSAPLEDDAPVVDAYQLDPVAFERHQRRLADAEQRQKREAPLPTAPGGDAMALEAEDWKRHLAPIGGLPLTHNEEHARQGREARARRAEQLQAQSAELQAKTAAAVVEAVEELKVVAAAVAPSRARNGLERWYELKAQQAEQARKAKEAAAAAAEAAAPITTGLEANEPAPPRPGEGR